MFSRCRYDDGVCVKVCRGDIRYFLTAVEAKRRRCNYHHHHHHYHPPLTHVCNIISARVVPRNLEPTLPRYKRQIRESAGGKKSGVTNRKRIKQYKDNSSVPGTTRNGKKCTNICFVLFVCFFFPNFLSY